MASAPCPILGWARLGSGHWGTCCWGCSWATIKLPTAQESGRWHALGCSCCWQPLGDELDEQAYLHTLLGMPRSGLAGVQAGQAISQSLPSMSSPAAAAAAATSNLVLQASRLIRCGCGIKLMINASPCTRLRRRSGQHQAPTDCCPAPAPDKDRHSPPTSPKLQAPPNLWGACCRCTNTRMGQRTASRMWDVRRWAFSRSFLSTMTACPRCRHTNCFACSTLSLWGLASHTRPLTPVTTPSRTHQAGTVKTSWPPRGLCTSWRYLAGLLAELLTSSGVGRPLVAPMRQRSLQSRAVQATSSILSALHAAVQVHDQKTAPAHHLYALLHDDSSCRHLHKHGTGAQCTQAGQAL